MYSIRIALLSAAVLTTLAATPQSSFADYWDRRGRQAQRYWQRQGRQWDRRWDRGWNSRYHRHHHGYRNRGWGGWGYPSRRGFGFGIYW